MRLTRRDFLTWLAGVGGAHVLPTARPAAPEVSPLIVPATPATPALVVPERRLRALDGTMLTTRTDPPGPLVTLTGPTRVRLEYCTVEGGWQHLPPEQLRDSGPLEARLPGAARSLRAVCTAEGGLVFTAD